MVECVNVTTCNGWKERLGLGYEIFQMKDKIILYTRINRETSEFFDWVGGQRRHMKCLDLCFRKTTLAGVFRMDQSRERLGVRRHRTFQ